MPHILAVKGKYFSCVPIAPCCRAREWFEHFQGIYFIRQHFFLRKEIHNHSRHIYSLQFALEFHHGIQLILRFRQFLPGRFRVYPGGFNTFMPKPFTHDFQRNPIVEGYCRKGMACNMRRQVLLQPCQDSDAF